MSTDLISDLALPKDNGRSSSPKRAALTSYPQAEAFLVCILFPVDALLSFQDVTAAIVAIVYWPTLLPFPWPALSHPSSDFRVWLTKSIAVSIRRASSHKHCPYTLI
jgi:hypothetical protein